jgi:2-polyprenyl-3-methyl-5-hydroxy-6-metoxy-1,4-benzoquinol methylase
MEDHWQQKEKVIATYKQWAPRIQSHHQDAFHVIEQALTERTLQTCILPLPKDIPILDIGGGDGRWSRFLAKQGFTNILLTDISPDILAVAQNLAKQENVEDKIKFQELDVENFDLPGRFGVVLCLGGVLSHCLNYKQALQNIYKVLQDRSIAIFSVDSFYAAKITAGFIDDPKELEMLLSQGISKQYFNLQLPYYCKYFRYNELKEALVQCHFQILRVHSRPQVTMFDLGARFSSIKEFQKTLDKEVNLSAKEELLDFGSQLEVVVTR